ncbi:MAG: hypothetical protein P8X73_05710 [Ignavibacteriaceae bacterium]
MDHGARHPSLSALQRRSCLFEMRRPAQQLQSPAYDLQTAAGSQIVAGCFEDYKLYTYLTLSSPSRE